MKVTIEFEVAAKILGVLPPDSVAFDRDDGRLLHYRIEGPASWRLRSVVFAKESLRRLVDDPAAEVKIDYLQRDLLRAAGSRRDFVYPNGVRERLRHRMALPEPSELGVPRRSRTEEARSA